MGGGAFGGGAFVAGAVGGGALGGGALEAEDAELEDVARADDPLDWPPGRSRTPCRSRAIFFLCRLLPSLHSLADLILSEAVLWYMLRNDLELPVVPSGPRLCLRRWFLMRRELRVFDTLNLLPRNDAVAGRSSQITT